MVMEEGLMVKREVFDVLNGNDRQKIGEMLRRFLVCLKDVPIDIYSADQERYDAERHEKISEDMSIPLFFTSGAILTAPEREYIHEFLMERALTEPDGSYGRLHAMDLLEHMCDERDISLFTEDILKRGDRSHSQWGLSNMASAHLDNAELVAQVVRILTDAISNTKPNPVYKNSDLDNLTRSLYFIDHPEADKAIKQLVMHGSLDSFFALLNAFVRVRNYGPMNALKLRRIPIFLEAIQTRSDELEDKLRGPNMWYTSGDLNFVLPVIHSLADLVRLIEGLIEPPGKVKPASTSVVFPQCPSAKGTSRAARAVR